MYKGLKEFRATNNVEYELWFYNDDIKCCQSGNKRKKKRVELAYSTQHVAYDDRHQFVEGWSVGSGGRRIPM